MWLPAGVKLTTADAQVDVTAGFNRCIPACCFADADINESVIKKLGGMATNGKLQLQDAGQHDVAKRRAPRHCSTIAASCRLRVNRDRAN